MSQVRIKKESDYFDIVATIAGGGAIRINGEPICTMPVGFGLIMFENLSPAELYGGTWEQISAGYALWTASSGAGETISAGLPNITGGNDSSAVTEAIAIWTGAYGGKGALTAHTDNRLVNMTNQSSATWGWLSPLTFDASAGEVHNGEYSNLVYGKSDTVQPPAVKIYLWKRIA